MQVRSPRSRDAHSSHSADTWGERMFGSNTLEIALGLTLIYTMFSLVCTAGNELIASVFRLRARNLADGIRNLLSIGAAGGNSALAQSLGSKTSIDAPGTLAQQLYDHPLIQSLYRRGQTPSYIPSRTFALALMDVILPSNQPRPTTIESIERAINAGPAPEGVKRVSGIIQDAANTLETGQQLKAAGVVDVQKLDTALNQVQENIEVWFNDSMDRVSGWYKQKTQAIVFALAVTFTVMLNVDTIQLVNRLSYDSALRHSLVAQAEKLAEQPPAYIVVPTPAAPSQPIEGAAAQLTQPPPRASMPSAQLPRQQPAQSTVEGSAASRQAAAQLQAQVAALSQTGIPLGWSQGARPSDQNFFLWWLTKIFGLLLTAGAASLGAPFWFDVLNKNRHDPIRRQGPRGGAETAERASEAGSPWAVARRKRPAMTDSNRDR